MGVLPRTSGLAIVATVAGCAVGVGGDNESSAITVGEDGTSAVTLDDDGGPGGPASDTEGDDATGPGPGTIDDAGTDGDASETDGGFGEICNGLDDDGDGQIDEDVEDVTCGEGVCMASVPGCPGGVPGQCFPGMPGTESCNGLDDDCDGATDEELVQSCDSACGAGTQACAAGAWGACDAPLPQAEVCDVADNDCNGAVDDGVAGCQVDVHRSYHPVTGEHFYTTDMAEAMCCGYNLEFAAFFSLYVAAQPQTTAFYRCYGVAPNNFHHYTTDPGCEGVPVNEGIVGYIGTAALPGSTALYRSYYPVNGDHFFTNSLAEHNAAVAGGYVDEGAVGYVW